MPRCLRPRPDMVHFLPNMLCRALPCCPCAGNLQGSALLNDQGRLQLDLEWCEPHAGKLTEVFEIQCDGRLHVTTLLFVKGETLQYTLVSGDALPIIACQLVSGWDGIHLIFAGHCQ